MLYLPHPIGFKRPASHGPRETVQAVASLLDGPTSIELLDVLLEVWVADLPEAQLTAHYEQVLGQLNFSENLALMSVYQTDVESHGRGELVRSFSDIADEELRREAVKLAEGLRLTELLEQGATETALCDYVLARLDSEQLHRAAHRAQSLYARWYIGTPN